MKIRLSATIAIYFLLVLMFTSLYTHASNEDNNDTKALLFKNSDRHPKEHEKYASDVEQKWKTFSRLILEKHELQKNPLAQSFLQILKLAKKKTKKTRKENPKNKNNSTQIDASVELSNSQEIQKSAYISENSLLLSKSKKDILLEIVFQQFSTIKDILVLRTSCKAFQNLLYPNHAKMVTFCIHGYCKIMTDTIVDWGNLKYFLNQSYSSAFDKMEMIFNIKENHYALFTRATNENILIWKQPNLRFTDPIQQSKILNIAGDAWARITNEGNVETGGNKECGGDSSNVQPQLKNVKMIVSNSAAFAALVGDGSIVTWGLSDYRNPIPLQNVKNIFSTTRAFAALFNDGSVYAWGNPWEGGQISDEIQTKLKNVKMLLSTDYAFAALLNDGGVFAWGKVNYGGHIPYNIQEKQNNNNNLFGEVEQIRNVQMIFATDYAFAALLNDGSVLTWGDPDQGGKIPDDIALQLKDVKTIIATKRKFTAQLHNGKTIPWGTIYEKWGRKY